MHRRLRWFLLATAFALSGCGYVQRVGVYKIEINQGNYVTQDMVDRLKTGMSKGQVRLVLGTPLVTDIFHVDRWDYVYHHEKEGKLVEQRRFAVFFADDELAKWEGDQAPPAPSYRPTTAEAGSLAKEGRRVEPRQEEKGFFGKLWEKLGF